jgi:hypothetical protein
VHRKARQQLPANLEGRGPVGCGFFHVSQLES